MGNFEDLLSDAAGGAALGRNSVPMQWTDSIVKGNEAELGGGLCLTNGASIAIVQGDTNGSRVVFDGNVASDGGAFMCLGCCECGPSEPAWFLV